MRHFKARQRLRNDADNPAACRQCSIGDRAHKAHISAAVHQSKFLVRQELSQCGCSLAVLCLSPETGAAENTDAFHYLSSFSHSFFSMA
jgi:hypothetical protein